MPKATAQDRSTFRNDAAVPGAAPCRVVTAAPLPESKAKDPMSTLLVFSHLRWNFVYQRPQHLLSRLARSRPVVVFEEPVHGDGEPRLERIEPCPGIVVLRPHTPLHAVGFHDDQLPALKALLAGFLAAEGVDDYVAWLYTPMALPLLADLAPKAVVYDCMDELAAFDFAPRQLRQREAALLQLADVLFAGGPSLYEARRDRHPNAHCFPSAVDAAHYAPAAADCGSSALAHARATQQSIAGPRLGFFGVIDERLDLGLLDAIAAAEPGWQIVMVGPVVKIDQQSLPRRPNIHWLGQQSYDALPGFVAGWDVCLMPFALNESTRFISPTKTLEYMAAEKPVVSTAVPDVVSLYGDVVRIAGDAEAFVAACREALAESPEVREKHIEAMRQRVAQYSWERTAGEMARLVDEAVAAPRQPRPAAPALLHQVPALPESAAVLAPRAA